MVTLSDVAKAAGVSVATASRTFSSPDLLKSDTCQRVLIAARELHYVPTSIRYARSDMDNARSINKDVIHGDINVYYPHKASDSQTVFNIKICLANGNKPDPIYTSAINGAILNAFQLEAKLYNFILSEFYGVDELLTKQYNNALEHVDIIIIIGNPGIEQINQLKAISQYIVLVTDCPAYFNQTAILVNNHYTNAMPTLVDLIAPDNFQGAYDAVKYLIHLGHTKIGIAFDSGDECYRGRLHGGISALSDASLNTNDRLDLNDISPFECKRHIFEYLVQQTRPTAVFALTDRIAYDIIDVCRFNNIKIPADLSLVGFDDAQYSRMVVPALTTVKVDMSYLGRLTARAASNYQIIHKEYARNSQLYKPVSLRVTCPLVIRDSTSSPLHYTDSNTKAENLYEPIEY
jgi:DNA-binding LacI/PurR family transcriptional regulator